MENDFFKIQDLILVGIINNELIGAAHCNDAGKAYCSAGLTFTAPPAPPAPPSRAPPHSPASPAFPRMTA